MVKRVKWKPSQIKKKHIVEENMCGCAFTGFGQMILTNSSWGQIRSSFYANCPVQRVFIGEERGGVVWKA